MLKQSWFDNLINRKDTKRTHPLHVYDSTINFQCVDLVNNLQADQDVVNNKNMTSFDVVVHSDIFFFKKRGKDNFFNFNYLSFQLLP